VSTKDCKQAYFDDVARMQVTLTDEEEVELLTAYKEIDGKIKRLCIESEEGIVATAEIFNELTDANRSIAKMGKDFNSKKKGHNTTVAKRITTEMEEGGWDTDAIINLNLADWVYDTIKMRIANVDTVRSDKIKHLEDFLREIEDKLVCSALMAAREIAKRYTAKGFGIEEADLIQEANIGVFEAVGKYDLEYRSRHGQRIKFITYAYNQADKKVREYIMENSRLIRLPRSRLGVVFVVLEALTNLEGGDKEPAFEDIVSEVNKILCKRNKTALKYDEVGEAVTLLQENLLSIDLNVKSGNIPRPLSSMLMDTEAIPSDEQVFIKERKQIIDNAIRNSNNINRLQGMILRIRYLENRYNLTYEEVSRVLFERGITKTKLSRERIRQMEIQAIKSLSNNKELKGLHDDLS
jgi:RNA polymerase sigma factor (sigma-70 family)